MIQLFIHPKFGKTGTSSIQTFFAMHRKLLSSDFSLLYPNNGTGIIDIDSHHGFAIAFKDNLPQYSFSDMLDNLENEILTSGCTKVLISTEILPHELLDSQQFKSFLTRINATLFLIFTVRDQVSWLISMMSQIICDLESDLFVTPLTASLYLHDQLDFNKEVAKWSRKDYVERTIVLPYCSNIIPSFLRAIGLKTFPDIAKEKIILRNKSLHLSRYIIANTLKRVILSTFDVGNVISIKGHSGNIDCSVPQAIVYALIESLKQLKDDNFASPLVYISSEEQVEILNKYNDSNECLCNSYNVSLTPLSPAFSNALSFQQLTEVGKSTLLEYINTQCSDLGINQPKQMRLLLNEL